MSIFEKFKIGFKKSAENISSGFREILIKKEIDDNSLDKIEEFLISSDVGIDSASEIRNILAQEKIDPNLDIIKEINKILKNYIISSMTPFEKKEFFNKNENLNVVLIAGVNGSGKTTTIGKIAKIFKQNNNKVILSASDTFRAAAIEQLEEWSLRAGVDLIKQKMGSDPASVSFDTLNSAINKDYDIVIIDTAGRLHNKVNLMNELSKVSRVMQKLKEDAPHEILLVLDGSTGQNAYEQAKQFSEVTKVTSMMVTKLDGTAKGGVVIGISDQLNIPIKYIGTGESIDDIQMFDKVEFVESFFQKKTE